jgi:hypothetical protein
MNIFINDRSDLNEVVAVIPSTHPTNATGLPQRVTRRMDLDRDWHGRRDVVFINGTRSKREYFLEVTPTGFIGDLWVLDVLTEEQHTKLMLIALKMRENAAAWKPAEQLLNHYR